MDIGEAVNHLKRGEKVARKGWNGKGMWLKYWQAGYVSEDSMGKALGLTYAELPTALPFVVIKTADNSFVPWLCSQSDLLATDWEVV